MRSRQLGFRKRTAQDLSRILRLDSFVDQVMRMNSNYFWTQEGTDLCCEEHFEDNVMKDKLTKGKGIHNVLEY